jgi:hypothetical protein
LAVIVQPEPPLASFSEHFSPKIVAELNNYRIEVVKARGPDRAQGHCRHGWTPEASGRQWRRGSDLLQPLRKCLQIGHISADGSAMKGFDPDLLHGKQLPLEASSRRLMVGWALRDLTPFTASFRTQSGLAD